MKEHLLFVLVGGLLLGMAILGWYVDHGGNDSVLVSISRTFRAMTPGARGHTEGGAWMQEREVRRPGLHG
jgi:hypothetical protein